VSRGRDAPRTTTAPPASGRRWTTSSSTARSSRSSSTGTPSSIPFNADTAGGRKWSELRNDGTTVNGALPFNPTGSWDTWSTTSFTAALPAGSQVPVRASTTGSNGANIDSLTMTADVLTRSRSAIRLTAWSPAGELRVALTNRGSPSGSPNRLGGTARR
jgi:hypothetical protein